MKDPDNEMGGSETTNISYKIMIIDKVAGGCYILVITPGVSCVFGCSGSCLFLLLVSLVHLT